MPRLARRPLAGLLLVPLLLGAVACGDDDGGEAAAGTAGEATGADDIPAGITLRVGEQSPVGELSFELGGFNDDLPYEIEYVRFNSGPLVNEGFAAGAIDIGSMGDTPAIGAAARGLPVSVLGVTTSDGPGSILVASPESGVESLEDLAGKRVAFTTGTAQHGLVLRALDSVGLEQADVTQVDVPLQDLPSVLESGDADVSVISYEAEVKYTRAHPDAVRLTTAAELPGAGSYTLVANAAFDDPGTAAAVYDYLERRIEAQQWIVDNPDIWLEEFYVKERHQTPEDAAVVIEGTGDTEFVPITDELQAIHQELADLLLAAGGFEDPVDVSSVYRPESIERSNEVLARVTG